jgi:hypothetical protein
MQGAHCTHHAPVVANLLREEARDARDSLARARRNHVGLSLRGECRNTVLHACMNARGMVDLALVVVSVLLLHANSGGVACMPLSYQKRKSASMHARVLQPHP